MGRVYKVGQRVRLTRDIFAGDPRVANNRMGSEGDTMVVTAIAGQRAVINPVQVRHLGLSQPQYREFWARQHEIEPLPASRRKHPRKPREPTL